MTPDQERAMQIALNVKRTQKAIAAEILRAKERGTHGYEALEKEAARLERDAAELEGA